MITVQEERPIECIGQLLGLWHDHGLEVVGKDFNLDLVGFAAAVEHNRMKFFVARTEDRTPVGYAAVNVFLDLMQATETAAEVQAFYVKPEYRGRVSIRLLKTMECALKAHGTHFLYFRTPAKNPTLSAMLDKPALGYKSFEVVHLKVL